VSASDAQGVPLDRILEPFEAELLAGSMFTEYRLECARFTGEQRSDHQGWEGEETGRQEIVGRGTVLRCGGRTKPAADVGDWYVLVLDESGTTTSWGIGTGGWDLPTARPGLLCREYMATPGFERAMQDMGGLAPWNDDVLAYQWALAYWYLEGSPDRMDVDGNGIPCELLFDPDVVAAIWAGDFSSPTPSTTVGSTTTTTDVVDPGAAAPVHVGTESVVILDDAGSVGNGPSLVLDGEGCPVVSYWDQGNSNVKLVHCDDPGCTGAGNSVSIVDDLPRPSVSQTSVRLDGAGHPVIAYAGFTDVGLRLAHCNDPNCVGGDESISTLDDSGNIHVSLVLDESGHPVIAYASDDNLKLAHCNDPDCVGGDESISSVAARGGTWATLQLDESGHPVIVHYGQYHDGFNRLTLVHCNDPDCVGGDESITNLEPPPHRYWNYGSPSRALDDAGRPVISYIVSHNDVDDLMLLRCDDPNCVGGGEAHVLLDEVTGSAQTSLVLDDDDRPVIAYSDRVGSGVDPGTNLLIATCSDPFCAELAGPIVILDSSTNISVRPSLALSESGNPVVAYEDLTNTDLKLVACDDPACL
jgi:hypothetical protein